MKKAFVITLLIALTVLMQGVRYAHAESENDELTESEHSQINEREELEFENEARMNIKPNAPLPNINDQIMPTSTPTPTAAKPIVQSNSFSEETPKDTITPTPGDIETNVEVQNDQEVKNGINLFEELKKLLVSLKKIVFTVLS